MVDAGLKEYVEREIAPLYDGFDAAHRRNHMYDVIGRSLDMACRYGVDENIAYAVAAFHDLGLSVDRKTHHIHSGRIIRSSQALSGWFTAQQIEMIAQAAEDHRASSETEPRSIYGKIVAEADRLIDAHTVMVRTVQYSIAHYPDFDREQHFERFESHIHEKYAKGGYLKLWLEDSPNREPLESFQASIERPGWLREQFDAIWAQI